MSRPPGESSGGGADPSSGGDVAALAQPRQPWEKQLGRYELMDVLGHGAMATVFRARDTQLGRQVAVKVMTLAVAARSDSAERFRREAQAVAAIKHAGIVEIFDFVAASGAEPAYIVSELIEGPTLKSWLEQRRGRVLPEMAALLALPLAEALAVAHTRGVVHRDVKPDNVMIDRGGGGCRVVLTDFGVAHVTGLETMTATGALVGSPAYMSPEQARGHEVGPSSDVWAAGVLLYEMATGHLPFTGRDPLMVVAAIARGTYRRPSQVSPYAGSAFDEICVRCLQPAGAGRYNSAGELAADLRAFCAEAGLEPVGENLRSWMESPERFEADVRARTADRAVASARKHARRGEFARALTELSRASAYVPKHAEADRLIAKISSRRRWLKLGAVAAAIIGVGAIMMVLAPRLTTPEETELRQTAAANKKQVKAVATRAAAAAAASGAGGAPGAGGAAHRAGGQKGTTGASGKRRPRPKPAATPPAPAPPGDEPSPGPLSPSAGGGTGRGQSSTAEPAMAAPPSLLETDSLEAPAVTAPPPVATPRPVPVHVFVERVLCDPSIDNEKSARSPLRKSLLPGRHRIYCSTTRLGKVLVATLDVGAEANHGQAVHIRIRLDAQGRPELDVADSRLSPGTRIELAPPR